MQRVPIWFVFAISAALLFNACGAGSPDWRRFSDACLQGDIVAAHMELSKPFAGKAFNDAWRRSKSTPLHVAASSGRTELVRQLLEKGVDPDLESESGNTALVEAAGNGQLDTVRTLLDAGAKVNRPGPDARSSVSPALFAAVSTGQTAVAETLLDRGASVQRARPVAGGSLLFAAALGAHDDASPCCSKRPLQFPTYCPRRWSSFANAGRKSPRESRIPYAAGSSPRLRI